MTLILKKLAKVFPIHAKITAGLIDNFALSQKINITSHQVVDILSNSL